MAGTNSAALSPSSLDSSPRPPPAPVPRNRGQETNAEDHRGLVFFFGFVWKRIFKRNRDNKEKGGKKVGREDEKRETRQINRREKVLGKNKFYFCALPAFLHEVYSRYGHL